MYFTHFKKKGRIFISKNTRMHSKNNSKKKNQFILANSLLNK